jgi:hypothetical protein
VDVGKQDFFARELVGTVMGKPVACSNCPPTISDENEIEEDKTGEHI